MVWQFYSLAILWFGKSIVGCSVVCYCIDWQYYFWAVQQFGNAVVWQSFYLAFKKFGYPCQARLDQCIMGKKYLTGGQSRLTVICGANATAYCCCQTIKWLNQPHTKNCWEIQDKNKIKLTTTLLAFTLFTLIIAMKDQRKVSSSPFA